MDWMAFALVAIYFLPTIVALGKPMMMPVFILNLLLGWTVIGWVVALVVAVA